MTSNWRRKSWIWCSSERRSNRWRWASIQTATRVQLCYTSEVVNSALATLQASALPGELHLREGLALVAMVGAGVCKNPLHSHRFYQQLKDQPVEFIWQAEDGISPWRYCAVGRPRC